MDLGNLEGDRPSYDLYACFTSFCHIGFGASSPRIITKQNRVPYKYLKDFHSHICHLDITEYVGENSP